MTIRVVFAAVAALLAAVLPAAAAAPAGAPQVALVEVTGEVDLGMSSLVERAVREAEAAGVRLLVVRVDTPGGRVDAALRMRSALLGSQVPTVAFVDREALSAGALVALAAEQVWFAPGGVMGAATPVFSDGRTADEKTVSALRAVFRSTALERGRDPAVAEAMVDPEVEAVGAPAGRLLTLDGSQAAEAGYAEGVSADVPALLAALGLDAAEVVRVGIAPAERLVRVLTGPSVAGLLLSVGLWLLVNGLLRSGGLGLGSLVGAAALGLFLFGHALAGLAGRESFLLVGVGVVLLAVEVLLVPGFGVAGAAGLAALLVGAALALYDPGSELLPAEAFREALGTVSTSAAFALLLLIAGMVLLGRFADDPRLARHARLVLGAKLATPEPDGPAAGSVGVAETDLRPSGIAVFGGVRTDVVAEEGFLPAGSRVVLVSDQSYRRVVRAVGS